MTNCVIVCAFSLIIWQYFHAVGIVEAKAQFQITGKSMECSSDSDLVANKTCEMKGINETKQLYSIDVYFGDGVEINDLWLQLSWMYKTSNDVKFKPFLGLSNVTIDLCHYLVNGNSMMVDLFLEDVKKHSNLIHSCPFKGHCYVKDLGTNLKRFPAFIPNGEYYMTLIFFSKLNGTDEVLLKAKLTVDVKAFYSK